MYGFKHLSTSSVHVAMNKLFTVILLSCLAQYQLLSKVFLCETEHVST